MKIIKGLIGISILLTIIFTVLYMVPYKHKIDKKMSAVQCRIGDQDYIEEVTVIIKGEYKQYLFKKDTFEGAIIVDCYDFTSQVPLKSITFRDSYGELFYWGNLKGRPVMESLGFLVCTPDFSKLLIGVDYKDGWYGKNGLYICAPADDHEQAVKIASELSKKSRWLSAVKWN